MGNAGRIEFSIPYNGNLASLPVLFDLNNINNNAIREVYLAGPQEFSAAARIMPKMELPELISIINEIHAHGIRVNLLLNAVCEGSAWYNPDEIKKKMQYIGMLHKEHGVEAVTVANPLYIKEIKDRYPDIEISASVLSIIDSVERAVYFHDMGADVIVPDKCINRDLETLKQIKDATNAEVKIMVNSGCLYKCPFERFHAAFVSHKSVETFDHHDTYNAQEIFFKNCSELVNKNRALIFKSSWIRPEDLCKYAGITNYFKISGRSHPKWADISRAYLEESWNGNLLELMDASLRFLNAHQSIYIDNKELDRYQFFDHVTNCGRNCKACNYCEELASKVIQNN
ncbi:MAG: U32 family peptidase [Dehalococcoidales bacterium]|nr:U32 family peptidase [Dehalococcoidales bacterium]